MTAYTQTRDANWKVPYVGGWCLKYVQDAFGTDHPYPSAIAAWNANYGGGNHPNERPLAGITVPVYFTLGTNTNGHVAISLSDGTVASSAQAGSHPEGFIYPNLQSMINAYAKYNGGCTYLGWSEYVGTVRVVQNVIQGGNNMIPNIDQLDALFMAFRGRPAGGSELNYVGTPYAELVIALNSGAEHDALVKATAIGEQAIKENWQAQLNKPSTAVVLQPGNYQVK